MAKDRRIVTPAKPPGIQNSVRMDAPRLREYLDELDRKGNSQQHDPRRSHVRWPFRHQAVPIKVLHPGGGHVTINVACRNISTGGMSFLHSAFMHLGTNVIANLPLVGGQTLEIEATVKRCQHVSGTCHEIGIAFKSPVNPRNFVELDPFDDGFAVEKVVPDSLEGTVLYLEDSSLSQSMLRHQLRDTRIRLRLATTTKEAIAILAEGVDLVLCDYMLGDEDGAKFVQQIRMDGCTTPVIMITADTSEKTKEKLIQAEADAFLAKPVSVNLLHRALAEFLSGEGGVGLRVSSLGKVHPNAGMLETFADEMHKLSKELEVAMSTANVQHCRNLVLQIAGAAPSMGFAKLAKLAQEADRAVSSSMSIEESQAVLLRLVRATADVSARVADAA